MLGKYCIDGLTKTTEMRRMVDVPRIHLIAMAFLSRCNQKEGEEV